MCMQVLVTYGRWVVGAGSGSSAGGGGGSTVADPYAQRYKGIWICLTILQRALVGSYVNFGVFDLYGDPALKVPTYLVGLFACLCPPAEF